MIYVCISSFEHKYTFTDQMECNFMICGFNRPIICGTTFGWTLLSAVFDYCPDQDVVELM